MFYACEVSFIADVSSVNSILHQPLAIKPKCPQHVLKFPRVLTKNGKIVINKTFCVPPKKLLYWPNLEKENAID